jgi:hypothetical protein
MQAPAAVLAFVAHGPLPAMTIHPAASKRSQIRSHRRARVFPRVTVIASASTPPSSPSPPSPLVSRPTPSDADDVNETEVDNQSGPYSSSDVDFSAPGSQPSRRSRQNEAGFRVARSSTGRRLTRELAKLRGRAERAAMTLRLRVQAALFGAATRGAAALNSVAVPRWRTLNAFRWQAVDGDNDMDEDDADRVRALQRVERKRNVVSMLRGGGYSAFGVAIESMKGAARAVGSFVDKSGSRVAKFARISARRRQELNSVVLSRGSPNPSPGRVNLSPFQSASSKRLPVPGVVKLKADPVFKAQCRASGSKTWHRFLGRHSGSKRPRTARQQILPSAKDVSNVASLSSMSAWQQASGRTSAQSLPLSAAQQISSKASPIPSAKLAHSLRPLSTAHRPKAWQPPPFSVLLGSAGAGTLAIGLGLTIGSALTAILTATTAIVGAAAVLPSRLSSVSGASAFPTAMLPGLRRSRAVKKIDSVIARAGGRDVVVASSATNGIDDGEPAWIPAELIAPRERGLITDDVLEKEATDFLQTTSTVKSNSVLKELVLEESDAIVLDILTVHDEPDMIGSADLQFRREKDTDTKSTIDADAYSVLPSEAAVLSVPLIGELLNALDGLAYRIERVIMLVTRRLGAAGLLGRKVSASNSWELHRSIADSHLDGDFPDNN